MSWRRICYMNQYRNARKSTINNKGQRNKSVTKLSQDRNTGLQKPLIHAERHARDKQKHTSKKSKEIQATEKSECHLHTGWYLKPKLEKTRGRKQIESQKNEQYWPLENTDF